MSKRHGAGKANWGRPGDEIIEASIDENDPAYDSADELFGAAFGSNSRDTNYDWAVIADLTDQPEFRDCKMNHASD